MNWEDVVKEDIEKGMIKDIKNAFVKYIKTRKFKVLTRKYIKTISGDTFWKLHFPEEHYPDLQGDWPSHSFDLDEMKEAGEAMKIEIVQAFIDELNENWGAIWYARQKEIMNLVNYVDSGPDEI